MINDLKNQIHQLLQEAIVSVENNQVSAALEPLEAAFEKLLIADYLTKRLNKQNQFQQKFIRDLEKAVDEKAKTFINQPEVSIEAENKIVSGYNLMPEVKVVPPPDGPPAMPREDDVEKVEKTAQSEPIGKFQKLSEPLPVFSEKPVMTEPTHQSPLEPEPIHQITKTIAAEKAETTVATKKTTIAEKALSEPKKASLHERLAKKSLSFGLNDRIAFVKHLFDGQAEDFNRVVNQLNTFENWQEAQSFINEIVKPDYNWSKAEEYETRFLSLIQLKFE